MFEIESVWNYALNQVSKQTLQNNNGSQDHLQLFRRLKNIMKQYI